mmetsp:Transcript_5750/g.16134  ORF Transcript_5750/g.16134 Transcript_5750/m.16134 type:complete len:316 (+) Transcript_5750:1154-2101(+)
MAIGVACHVGTLQEAPPKAIVPVGWESQLVEGVWWEAPLVEEVVDGQYTSGSQVDTVRAVLGGQEYRDERGMPVIGNKRNVLTIWDSINWDLKRYFQSRQREQAEAELVVSELAIGISVRCPHPHEAAGVVHKHKVHAILAYVVEVSNLMACTPEPDVRSDPSVQGFLVWPVSGSDDHNAMATARKSSRQGAHNISKPPCLAPGSNLRGNKYNGMLLARRRIAICSNPEVLNVPVCIGLDVTTLQRSGLSRSTHQALFCFRLRDLDLCSSQTQRILPPSVGWPSEGSRAWWSPAARQVRGLAESLCRSPEAVLHC